MFTIAIRHSTTAAVLTTLDEKLVSISSAAAAAKAEREGYDKELNGILKEIVEKQKDKNMASAMGGQLGRRGTHDSMDIDEPENVKGKSRRCVAITLLLPSPLT